MAKRPTLNDVGSGFQSSATWDQWKDEIEQAFDNTLSRDGSSPNHMNADLDMNSNDILNAGTGRFDTLYLDGVLAGTSLVSLEDFVDSRLPFETKTDVEASTVASSVDYVLTMGYSEVGDGGGALYKRVASEPSHEGKVRSSDGAWFELSMNEVNPAMFGADLSSGYFVTVRHSVDNASLDAFKERSDFDRLAVGS